MTENTDQKFLDFLDEQHRAIKIVTPLPGVDKSLWRGELVLFVYDTDGESLIEEIVDSLRADLNDDLILPEPPLRIGQTPGDTLRGMRQQAALSNKIAVATFHHDERRSAYSLITCQNQADVVFRIYKGAGQRHVLELTKLRGRNCKPLTGNLVVSLPFH